LAAVQGSGPESILMQGTDAADGELQLFLAWILNNPWVYLMP
jgi:hypothetical protein